MQEFFYRATGFSKKLFNRAVAFILHRGNNETNTDSYKKLTQKDIFGNICGHLISFNKETFKASKSSVESNNYELQVTSFLDVFFKAHTDVDHAPEEGNVKYVRLNWKKVYEEYKQDCKKVLVNPVHYPLFTSIRYA